MQITLHVQAAQWAATVFNTKVVHLIAKNTCCSTSRNTYNEMDTVKQLLHPAAQRAAFFNIKF